MKDLGVINNFLGIEFRVREGRIEMSQKKYCEKLLEKFNMMDCNPRATPFSDELDDRNDSPKFKNLKLYQELVGSLIYLMTSTRPDLAFIVNKLAQKMSNPSENDWKTAKGVLRYIKGTVDYKIVFQKSHNVPQLIAYTDADWAGAIDRKSISGCVFKICENSGFIHWQSKKQNIVALSSCESEYVALAHCVKEVLYLQKMFRDLYGENYSDQAIVYVDNQGAIKLANNPINNQRTKHIDVRYHFIRHHVQVGNIVLLHVPSSENRADALTKALSSVKLKYLLQL